MSPTCLWSILGSVAGFATSSRACGADVGDRLCQAHGIHLAVDLVGNAVVQPLAGATCPTSGMVAIIRAITPAAW
jgi:hypothetical protein